MNTQQRLSLEQIRAFVAASEAVGFEARHRREVYAFVNEVLRQQRYQQLPRAERGCVRRYLEKMTGRSRAQITRLISRYQAGEAVEVRTYRRHCFARRSTREDIELLAELDEAHETLSGPATRKLLERACYDFQDARYRRLAELSVAQLYRLRKSHTYRQRRIVYQRTRRVEVAIGERRRPEPGGRPGYLRVDTVHQGDLDGKKGVYHITAVDEVTQWQVMGAVERISEAWLEPLLDAVLEQFPFHIRGFHSDNGGEFVNHTVATLLGKLLAEQTKSRPNRCNDNALVECKNGAVVRKHMGYGYIAAPHAAAIQEFYRRHFNPYLNFHRPCAVPELKTDAKGRRRRVYDWYATPWENLRRLPDVARTLKFDVTIQQLNQQARAQTDTEAAAAMQQAKQKLFASFQQKRSA